MVYIAAFAVVAMSIVAFFGLVRQQEEEVFEMQYRVGILALMHLLEIGTKIAELYFVNAGKPGFVNLGDALFLAKLLYAGLLTLQIVQGQGFTVSVLDSAKSWTAYLLVLFIGLAFPPKLTIMGA